MKTVALLRNRFPFAIALSLTLFAATVRDVSAGEDGERAAIAATVDQYIEGGRKGSGEIMRQAFHQGANIYSAAGGGPIQLLFDLVDGKPPAGEIAYSVTNVDVAENIATARVEIDNWAGTKYTDMFTLLKTDDGWKIVSKVSYKH